MGSVLGRRRGIISGLLFGQRGWLRLGIIGVGDLVDEEGWVVGVCD